MVGSDVKQTRCTTCDAEHDYKHAKVPRQRRKAETAPALSSQVLAGGPKRVVHEPPAAVDLDVSENIAGESEPSADVPVADAPLTAAESGMPKAVAEPTEDEDDAERVDDGEEGPVHRPLIRATLPRQEGQPPLPRQGPDFTIRQPGGRPHRFRPRHQHGGQPFQGNRPGGGGMGGPMRSGMARQNNGRPPLTSRAANRHGSGRKRSK
jgi:hypothetical protein